MRRFHMTSRYVVRDCSQYDAPTLSFSCWLLRPQPLLVGNTLVGFELKSAEMDRGVGSYCFETSEANIDAAMLGAFCDN